MSQTERELNEARSHLPAGPPPAAMEALARRAEREGLLDVAYGQADSPFGPLTVAVTERGVVRLAYPEQPVDEVLEGLAQQVSPRILEAPARTDPVRRELERYFEGRLTSFASSIDWSLTHGFFRGVLQATAKIAYGDVSTYTDVAASAGSARAVRAAGNGLSSNPIPIVVPCHRVLRSGGGLGGYTGGLERKEYLLALEGRILG